MTPKLPASRGQLARLPWFAITLFLVWRVVIAVHAVAVVQTTPPVIPDYFLYQTPSRVSHEASLPAGSPLASWVEPWRRFDTTWYTHVALTGYTPGSVAIVFPPGYPLLIAALTPLVGSAVLAALVISSAACLAVFVLLYRLVERHFGDVRLARISLLLFASYPAAFFLLAGYTESLFLALALGALTAAEARRWVLAALCALMIGITRIQGFLIVLPLAWIAYQQVRAAGRARPAMAAALLAPFVSIGLYLLYLNVNGLGTLDEAWRSEWRAITMPPWVTVAAYFERLGTGISLPHENRDAGAVLFMFLSILVLGWRTWRSEGSRSGQGTVARPPWGVYLLYTLPPFLLFLMRYVPNEAQFNSVMRYSVMLFPCFIIAAFLVRRTWLALVIALALWAWQLDLAGQFVRWEWVG